MNTESLAQYLPEYLDNTLESELHDEVQAWLETDPLARDELMANLLPFLEQAVGHPVVSTPGLEQLVDLLRERSKTKSRRPER